MASEIATIERKDFKDVDSLPNVAIGNVKHISSYSWLESTHPSIVVPGCPPLWRGSTLPRKLEKDSGFVYISQNAARHPESPLEPLFRAVHITEPSFDVRSINIVTDRTNFRRLLSFIDPKSERSDAFTISLEAVNNTVIFGREDPEPTKFIGPDEFRGFTHNFQKANTKIQIEGSTGHHRIVSYQLHDMNILLRYEVDGYVDDGSLPHKFAALSLGEDNAQSSAEATSSSLSIQRGGHDVPAESIVQIKTRIAKKHSSFADVASQLWLSQTTKLVRALYDKGEFNVPVVQDVTGPLFAWEQDRQYYVRKLVLLVQRLVEITKKHGRVTVKYDGESESMSVISNVDGKKMLPDDLYLRWDETYIIPKADENGPVANELENNPPQTVSNTTSQDTTVEIGGVSYSVPLFKLPYLSTLAASSPAVTTITHPSIPLFDVALKGIQSGFRHCIRMLGPSIGQYRILCDKYKSLEVDVLANQTLDDIFLNIKAGKSDYDDSVGNKSLARDSAFRLIYFMFMETASGNALNKLFNAVFYVVSHPGVFKYKTRESVRLVYEDLFYPTGKQRINLGKWYKEGDKNDEDETTEQEDFSHYDSDFGYGWGSDSS